MEATVPQAEDAATLLPARIGHALEANDRAKYYLALLQSARAQADDPAVSFSSLRDERVSARIDERRWDHVVEDAQRVGPDLYWIPGVAAVHDELVHAIGEMLGPVRLAGADESIDLHRFEDLVRAAPELAGDRVSGAYIDSMTSAQRGSGDSLHLLVMDAHRALNRLQARVATVDVAGAATFGLEDSDREVVTAFMSGVHHTEALRFDHPGLATTATRAGPRLLIQNDLGTTAGHLLVIAIEEHTVHVTYTDVHRRRLEFFESLLEPYPVEWSNTRRQSGRLLGDYTLTTGRYVAPDDGSLLGFLRHLGSRLVFVLDWNRARKRIGLVVGNDDAMSLLRWAADHEYVHMAFLNLGGERLVYDAIEHTAKTPARYGERLIDVLGRDATLEVLRFALRITSDGLLHGRSHRLIRDELRAEMRRILQTAHRQVLDAGAEHASLVVEAAQALHGAVVRLGSPDGTPFLERVTRRAARWEHRADEILITMRETARRVDGGEPLAALVATADDAIDALEEALFLLTLVPADAALAMKPILYPVTAQSVATAREHLKAQLMARVIIGGSGSDDVEDFLVAVDQVVSLEHEADRADRAARAALVGHAPDFRTLYVADNVSRRAEDATDALLRSTLGLRDLVLVDVTMP